MTVQQEAGTQTKLYEHVQIVCLPLCCRADDFRELFHHDHVESNTRRYRKIVLLL